VTEGRTLPTRKERIRCLRMQLLHLCIERLPFIRKAPGLLSVASLVQLGCLR
jgi:hypothetical protein